MINISSIDYSIYDHPSITELLFYPRCDGEIKSSYGYPEAFLIPVEQNIVIGARLHESGKEAANILFFHGNGEIASDYDDLGHLYAEMQINFLPVDYRGYGKSNGAPSVTSMMRDCHIVFDYVKKFNKSRQYTGPFIVMGRSLGSASALELAFHYSDQIDALIIESGFAYSTPLLRLVGVDIEALGISEETGFRNIDKISHFNKPTLIIHAEFDHIISFTQGQALFDACPAKDKKLLKIPGANHNDIFSRSMSLYMESIKRLADKAASTLIV